MAKNYYDVTLAPASICQPARLVQQLTYQGYCDGDALRASLNSIIDMNPSSTLAVSSSNEANLRVGLGTLLGVLNASSRQGSDAELTHYTPSLMALERKLFPAKGTLDTLGDRISSLQCQFEYFDLQSGALMSVMATIYVDAISPLGSRIQTTGSPAALQDPQVQTRVRATLLVGIRVAVLWHQVGGGHLQLMFSHNCLTIQTEQILTHLTPEL